ncbi:hypothetical protein [Streptomyces sp. BF23-19]|uniref:hypothetical protein n=1 Tax=Streptomyces TaxID=1883 RepID=UPI0034E479A1|nr:hypothetical protein OG253_30960 [Streptomyces virginiae]
MTRTTPPRPFDVASVFPELAGMSRTATRLHPRPGAPTVHESSVGGPLLWPAVGEPLLTLDHTEWDAETESWRPVEEAHGASATPTDVTVGRGYTLQFYACPADPRHPPVTVMQ